MKKELLKGLTPEQVEKASQCKSQEELLALAKKEGVDLNEEQLDAISGGACVGPSYRDAKCPHCFAKVFAEYVETTPGDGRYHFVCPQCGYDWIEK